MPGPRVFSVPPAAPFLDTLAGALFDGRLIEGFDPADPFALADLTLYLPTRRAARAIRESFLSRLGRPVLLPRIRTLGDIDEDDLESGLRPPDPPPAVPALERQLALTSMVLAWSGALVRAAADLPEEELLVPASPADAARLATGLSVLIDHVGTDPAAWHGLFAEVPADLAKYWQITLEFLKIATRSWPDHLAERGLMDPGVRRDFLIRREAERLRLNGSAAPVVAAGSTGSIPATAELLAAIARLPNGAVVLPGLDQELDRESWEAIGADPSQPSGAGHPQYGLKKLIETLGVARTDVEPLAKAEGAPVLRTRAVSEAMRPAETAERWAEAPAIDEADKATALAGIGVVEAANEREEALAIAAILRGALEVGDQIAALVTPDRSLARRVAVELQRWRVEADDSAGRPLALTPPGVLARLTAEAALNGAAPETLLSLAKHPLAGFGQSRFETRNAARALERAILRGPRLAPGSAALRHALALAAQRYGPAAEEARERPGTAARTLFPDDWSAAENLAERIEAALAPLERLADEPGRIPLPELVRAHHAALSAVARDRDDAEAPVLEGEAGEALIAALGELELSAEYGPAIAPREYPGLFSALIERMVVREPGGLDPRIHIWGVLEARLQSVDVVVLAGLNEGTWPGRTRLDPLLSRPMRDALLLEPPERRIGLAAHDFSQALGHETVWLTRADRENGEPRVASRWLQRLTAYAGEAQAKAMRARGAAFLAMARRLDAPAAPPRPLPRPRPRPPIELRPRRLSATSIETLIRDPYAIYARDVLKLRPFESLGKLPDAAERGTLIHDILEQFVRERPAGPFDAAAIERLLEIGRAEFARHRDFPEVIALWWPRFERIARWFIRTEAARIGVEHRHVEGTGSIEVTPDFTLSARADRLDRLADGTLAIIDYKTGAPPTVDEVLTLSPQLPLEGLIARRGGFEGVPAGEPGELLYYRLSGRREGGDLENRSGRPSGRGSKPPITLPEALATTEQRLAELVALFADPETGYLSRKIPKRGRVYRGDYDHLARVAEWVASDEEVDEWPQ